MAEGEVNIQALFNSGALYVKSIISKLTNKQMLQFYGLYKQATEGPCTKPKPSWYEITEKQKWKAWSSLKNCDRKEAMAKYINLLSSVDPNWLEKPAENSNRWVHHSCMKNDDEIIDESEKTIFDWVKEKNVDKVKMFGKDVISEIDKWDDYGLGLLHWATDRGSLDIVKYLVENLKADVNLKDEEGQTPLHYAVSCEHDDVANYLIQAGAKTDVKDNDGLTPYEAARK